MMVETAVQVNVGLVWSFLKHSQISVGSSSTRPLTISDNGASIDISDSTKDFRLTIDNTF